MPNNIVNFDVKTKQLVDSLTATIIQAEGQLRLLCEVYLNAKKIDHKTRNFELAKDNSGLVEVEEKQDAL